MTRIALLLFIGLAASAEIRSDDCRIINGQDAKPGEYPYMASLRRRVSVKPSNPSGHSCGASVLTDAWALTAAHCCASVTNATDFYIYAGSIYLSKGGTNHTIEKVIMHELYDKESRWKNDICLVKLSRPFVIKDSIQQITLPPQDWPIFSGDKVTITGWGRTKPVESGCIPDTLQKGTNYTALTPEECNKLAMLEMFPGYLCAVGNSTKQSTWNGDSGGPLVKNGVQVGLTSFGYRPFGGGMPTVYARVTHYINWIKQKLGPDASKLKFLK
ncbi:UNVERIFIED_CONTAM: hypothetical protein PYX00_006241 [Menopon gallinae]|uniref:Peptidase S1 domain-containing protein n=1 Tax=Menopon gallinae TaxID=328185 RepID=A0AAW2HUU4_9NEOP